MSDNIQLLNSRLIEEVHELEDTIRQLELKSELSEDRLRDLQHTRLALEKEINTKRNTISYDRGQFKSFYTVWHIRRFQE